MADVYSVTLSQTAVESSPGEAIGNLFDPIATPTTRAQVIYVSLSAGGSMADQLQTIQIQRTTAVGTEGAGVVPENNDPDAPASELDAGENHSAEPTYTSATEFWENDVHIRALAQIQLQPEAHWKLAAVQNNGLGIRSFSGNYTGGAKATIQFLE